MRSKSMVQKLRAATGKSFQGKNPAEDGKGCWITMVISIIITIVMYLVWGLHGQREWWVVLITLVVVCFTVFFFAVLLTPFFISIWDRNRKWSEAEWDAYHELEREGERLERERERRKELYG